MTTDPDQIRAQVAALLADLPDIGPDAGAQAALTDSVIDDVVGRLEQAHEVLVHALESVEKD